jgi:hypothetical protein
MQPGASLEQDVLDPVQPPVQVVPADHQRRRQPDRVPVRQRDTLNTLLEA